MKLLQTQKKVCLMCDGQGRVTIERGMEVIDTSPCNVCHGTGTLDKKSYNLLLDLFNKKES